VNGVLFDSILLQQSIWQGCSLAPYLCLIATYALGYWLEASRVQGQVKGIFLPSSNQFLNIHLTDALTKRLD
jgi:hypothetical protein